MDLRGGVSWGLGLKQARATDLLTHEFGFSRWGSAVNYLGTDRKKADIPDGNEMRSCSIAYGQL